MTIAASVCRIVVAILVIGVFVAWPQKSSAQHLPGIEHCPSEVQFRLRQAKQFVVDYKKTLAEDYEIDGREGQKRRAERQIKRTASKLKFICKADNNCNSHTAFQGVVLGGNRVRICAARLSNRSFCSVVEIVAHEFGHNAHVPRERAGRHDRRGHDDPDQVYQFGYYARELCKIAYGMEFRVGDWDAPIRSPGLSPPQDIVVYPRKDFRGFPFHFSIAFLEGSLPADWDLSRYNERHANMNDLRHIGINDSISSIRINRGRWRVCSKRDGGGNCVNLDASVANMRDHKLNNKISSIEYLGE